MNPKVFTVEEANALVPSLKKRIEELRTLKAELGVLRDKVEVLRLLARSGTSSSNPDRVAYGETLERYKESAQRFEGIVSSIVDEGCLLKDLDRGLIDFHFVMDGRLVYLCWLHGEDAVKYWHSIEEGFAGRKPIGTLI